MSDLMRHEVDWSGWASRAEPLKCPACREDFQPNHPRRRFCGRPECPGRQRRRSATNVGSNPPRPARGRRGHGEGNVYALLADAMLEANARPPAGSPSELVRAAVELVRGVRESRPPAAERALTVRLLAVAAARTARLKGSTT